MTEGWGLPDQGCVCGNTGASPAGKLERPVVALVAHAVDDRGGMEQACSELIRHTHEQFRFIVVTGDLAPDLEPLVERWVRIPAPARPFPLKFLVFLAIASLRIRRLRPDLVHTVGALVLNRADVAAVHYCHAGARQAIGGLAPEGLTPARWVNTVLSKRLAVVAEQWCYRQRRLRCFAAVSPGVAGEVERFFPGVPASVVPNGVDLERFRPDRAAGRRIRVRNGVADEEVVVLFGGGDWERKGLALAIRAVANARSPRIRLVLWVVGTGDECRFRRLAEASGIGPLVRFFGHRSDIEDFYQGADIFVLPTLYETFSMASYEAAASGLPIVATSVSGIVDLVVSGETGYLVEASSSSIAVALRELGSDGRLRRTMGLEGRRRAERYSWENSTSDTAALYRSLLGRASVRESK